MLFASLAADWRQVGHLLFLFYKQYNVQKCRRKFWPEPLSLRWILFPTVLRQRYRFRRPPSLRRFLPARLFGNIGFRRRGLQSFGLSGFIRPIVFRSFSSDFNSFSKSFFMFGCCLSYDNTIKVARKSNKLLHKMTCQIAAVDVLKCLRIGRDDKSLVVQKSVK